MPALDDQELREIAKAQERRLKKLRREGLEGVAEALKPDERQKRLLSISDDEWQEAVEADEEEEGAS